MSYDFDIKSYSIQDLQTLFQLPPKTKYTTDDIVVKRNDFYERIMNSSDAQVNSALIRKLNAFLDEACDLLVYTLRDKQSDKRKHDTKNASVRGATVLYEEDSSKKRRVKKRQQKTSDSGTDSQEDMVLNYYHNTRAITTTNTYDRNIETSHYYDREKNEIIKKEPAEFKMVMQNEFNPGKMNPIHTPVVTKCLNIDTRFRDNLYTTQSSNFIFSLPDRIRKVVSMQLSAYEFPVTFYSTSSSYGNNFLNVFCSFYDMAYDLSMTAMRTVIIPDGNYSAMDLMTNINAQLCPRNSTDQSLINSNLDASGIFNCIQLSIDINANGSGSGKVTMAAYDVVGYTYANRIISVGMDFTLDINGNTDLIPITSKMGWSLGFIKPQYTGQTFYVADTLPDPASIRYLYLIVNDFNNCVNNNFVGAFNKWILNNNILARIPVNGQYFNILMENQLSQHLEPRKYFGPVDIQRLHIQILDDHGRVLDINNANYSICLTFKCLYD